MHSFTSLSASYSDVELFKNLNISLDDGKITCLTGPNGSGKTTLMNLILHEAALQGLTVFSIEQSLESILDRSPGQWQARRLFDRLKNAWNADLLLLDEPGNHLDDPSYKRFIMELKRISVPLLIITHDRRLLREAGRILHLEDGRLEVYGGDYDLYLEERNRQRESKKHKAEFADRQAKVAKRKLKTALERQSHRTADAEKWSKTQKIPLSLLHKYQERAEKTEARLENSHNRLKADAEAKAKAAKEAVLPDGRPFQIELESSTRTKSSIVFLLRDVNPEVNGRLLWKRGLSLQVGRNEHIAIVGKNGSGKTTLLDLIYGEHELYSGECQIFTKKVYYHRQRSAETNEERVMDFQEETWERYSEGEIRIQLARAGFTGQSVFRRVRELSGGELCRLNLVRASLYSAELMLMDEPTNDLDGRARDELLRTLKESAVSFVIVTHDLEFLEELGVDHRVDLDALV